MIENVLTLQYWGLFQHSTAFDVFVFFFFLVSLLTLLSNFLKITIRVECGVQLKKKEEVFESLFTFYNGSPRACFFDVVIVDSHLEV